MVVQTFWVIIPKLRLKDLKFEVCLGYTERHYHTQKKQKPTKSYIFLKKQIAHYKENWALCQGQSLEREVGHHSTCLPTLGQ